ncbi:MAG: BamA/TamA family outer membrane protein [Bacteroidetes bacterium]|nr:BamA/TamA family outer membrane protein [Bacteroidota bacterium]
MEIAINAFLFAKRNMDVDACQKNLNMSGKFQLNKIIVFFFVMAGHFCWGKSFVTLSLPKGGRLPTNHEKKLTIIVSGDSSFFYSKIHYPKSFTTEEEKQKILNNVRMDLYKYAYLTADFYKTEEDSAECKVFLQTGIPFKWVNLKTGNIDEEWLRKSGVNKSISGEVFNYHKLSSLMENLVGIAEENGYPFASVSLDSIAISVEGISANLKLTKRRKFVWDSLMIIGDSSINAKYLAGALGIKEGRPYSEKAAKQIYPRLRELVYIHILQPPVVSFMNDRATVKLFIEEKVTGRINGVLGLAPASSINKKFTITGEADLALLNLLGEGIEVGASYRNYLSSASQIAANISYPYIVGLPIGLSGNFSLQRFDSTYNTIDATVAGSFLHSGNDYLKFSYTYSQTNLLNGNYYAKQNVLPPFLDVNVDWFGLGFKTHKLDYILNPRKGYSIILDAETGVKKIKKNPSINEELYKNTRLSKVIYRAKISANHFIPIMKRSTLNLGLNAGILIDDDASYNQLFRFGGLNTLRGFDEGVFTANQYAIIKVEYRFLTDENSNLHIFSDAAWYSRKVQTQKLEDKLYSAGVGYNYYARVGVFSINFAVGANQNSSFDFNATKVHVGYLSRF